MDTYFHEKSPFEVNLEYKVKVALETQLQSGVITINLFNVAQKSIFDLMESSQFLGFLNSQLYLSLVQSPMMRRSNNANNISNIGIPIQQSIKNNQLDSSLGLSTSTPNLSYLKEKTTLLLSSSYPASNSIPIVGLGVPSMSINNNNINNFGNNSNGNIITSAVRTKQYLAKQKEKWSRYQQMYYNSGKSKLTKTEIGKLKTDLHRLESQLVQFKRMTNIIEKLKKQQQQYNNIEMTMCNTLLMQITDSVTNAFEIDRCSIWFYNNSERTHLICADLFDRNNIRHIKDIIITTPIFTKYFRSLFTEFIHTTYPSIIDSNIRLNDSKKVFIDDSNIKNGAVGFMDLIDDNNNNV